MYFKSILLITLAFAHCGQIVEPGKLVSVSGVKPSRGKDHFYSLGKSSSQFALPLGDWIAPERFVGMQPEAVYNQMLREGLSVRDLFRETANNQSIKLNFDRPINGDFSGDTCGYFDRNFKVELLDTNPQTSSTGNNHNGPAEVWIDDVRTHHTSNLLSAQPEVLDRSKYNCDKEWCQYKWYWIVFRAHQKRNPVSGAAFQMWVSCAMIKGNGKKPIAVVPTGKWMKDPRDKSGDYSVPRNLPGLQLSHNPSEKVVTGQPDKNSGKPSKKVVYGQPDENTGKQSEDPEDSCE